MISTDREPTTNAWQKAHLGLMKELLHQLQVTGMLTMTVNSKTPSTTSIDIKDSLPTHEEHIQLFQLL